MLDKTKDLLKETYCFKENTFELYERALKDCEEQFKMYDEIREFNQMKVLKAFQDERISDSHFTNSSGYGYDDIPWHFYMLFSLHQLFYCNQQH